MDGADLKVIQRQTYSLTRAFIALLPEGQIILFTKIKPALSPKKTTTKKQIC